MTRPYVIIGNPGERRVNLFCEALNRHNHSEITIVSYEDILFNGWDDWSSVLTPDTIVRIESPGENLRVVDHFLYLGATEEGATTSIEALNHNTKSRGEIYHPKQRFLGFQQVIKHIDRALQTYPVAHITNAPSGILTMFDKAATHEAFEQHQVPSPMRLPTIRGYDDLIEQMNAFELDRVFVKLSYSSSASGVVAIRRQRDRMIATTSTKMRKDHTERVRLFNSLKIQRYNKEEDIRLLIDTLAVHDVVVEAWIPKATFDHMTYDFRIVVIGGQAQHCVMRSSQSPMTNLHLGNARGDIDALRESIGQAPFDRAMEVAEAAFNAIGGMTYAGADVLLHRRDLSAHAIEINAFGDLVPRIFFEGEDTYGAEVLAINRLLGQEQQ